MVDWEGEGLEVMVRNNVGWVSGGGGGELGWGQARGGLGAVVGCLGCGRFGVRREVLFVTVTRLLCRFRQADQSAHVLYTI